MKNNSKQLSNPPQQSISKQHQHHQLQQKMQQNSNKQESGIYQRQKITQLQKSTQKYKNDNKDQRIQKSINLKRFQKQPISQELKNLLLRRCQLKKPILQSSSVYIQTGQIKRKISNNNLNQKNIISLIKQSSSIKLPIIRKNQTKISQDKLSKTLDYNSKDKNLDYRLKDRNKQIVMAKYNSTGNDQQKSQNKEYTSKTKQIPQYSNLNKTKQHLLKRKSMAQNQILRNSLSIEQRMSLSPQKLYHNYETNKFNSLKLRQSFKDRNTIGFDENIKKKYFKSIVDRYFPNIEQNGDSEQKIFYSPTAKTVNCQMNSFKSGKNKVNSRGNQQQSKFNNKQINKLPLLADQKDFLQKNRTARLPTIRRQNQFSTLQSSQHKSLLKKQSCQEFDGLQSSPLQLALTQSYLLQKIQEDEGQFIQNNNEAFYSQIDLSRSFSSFISNDKSQLIKNNSNHSLTLKNNSSIQNLKDLMPQKQNQQQNVKRIKTQKIKLYQNHSFCIYKVKYSSFQSISQKRDLKTLVTSYEFRKCFLNLPSLELKRRQIKAKSMIQKIRGNPYLFSIWQEDQFDKNCLKMNISSISPPYSPRSYIPLTLSKQLYKLMPIQQSIDLKYVLIKPLQQQNQFVSQQKLMKNQHVNLLKLLKCIACQLFSLQNQLLNNKISLNNILIIDQNRYIINQWSYSYFKEQYIIQQNKKFQKRLQPVFKNQVEQWFVTPEYLAPEILENLSFIPDQQVKYWKKIQGKKVQAKIVKQHDLFQFRNKSDVWSLGIMILQLITLIPIWIGQKCVVQNKKNPKISPRTGFLFDHKRNLLRILTKQSYMKQNLQKILRIQSQPYQLQEWLQNLLPKMLQLNPQKRIGLKQLISYLNSFQKKIKYPL